MNRVFLNVLKTMVFPVAITGAVVLGGVSLIPKPAPIYYDTLSDRENASLAAIPSIRVELEHLSKYEPLDPPTFKKILKWVCVLAGLEATITNSTTRRIDSINVQLKKLLARMSTKMEYNAEIEKEFRDASDGFLEACESQSFNAHMLLNSSS